MVLQQDSQSQQSKHGKSIGFAG
ncbi:hypothetical protein CCACVL1_03093 [Corchorus capsularis]|uniref:Uncharacterized protein n=1 Tax=Corchorus capsularis TaxID=210143 RepID=A0A1R3K2Z4_COCAP|nr:hypothetical protein CCACVL1_03093 [Corchorus capsularis]